MNDCPRHRRGSVKLPVLAGTVFFLSFIFPVYPSLALRQNTDCTICNDIPYQAAIPRAVDQAGDIVESTTTEEELQAIDAWKNETQDRILEFLTDWIAVSSRTLDATSAEQIFQDFEDTNQKWVNIIFNFPGMQELAPHLLPVVEDLFEDLPHIRSARPGDVPLANVFEWYQSMERRNPWGLSPLFHIPTIRQPALREKTLNALLREEIIHGFKNITVLHKEIVIHENGEIIFLKVVENGETVEKFVRMKDPTLIHEVLGKAREANLDPQLIHALEALTALIDENLILAVDTGLMDQELYDIIYGNYSGIPVTASAPSTSVFFVPDNPQQPTLSATETAAPPVDASLMIPAAPKRAEAAISRTTSPTAASPIPARQVFQVWLAVVMIPASLWGLAELIKFALPV